MTRPLRNRLSFVVALSFGLCSLSSVHATESVGAEITLTEATPIAQILDDPQGYAGDEVRVEGEVSGVCAMNGCWMELASPEGRKLRVQVEDGVVVIPADSLGARAVAQGVVTLREMSREEHIRWMRHLAEEKGETFDEAAIGDGPFQQVQLAGHGVRIEG